MKLHHQPFLGRSYIFPEIDLALKAVRQSDVINQIYLVGFGGTGKTSIAKEYAFRYQEGYSTVIWINVETETKMLNDVKLFLRKCNIDSVALEKWKISMEPELPWLLILDNVEDYQKISNL